MGGKNSKKVVNNNFAKNSKDVAGVLGTAATFIQVAKPIIDEWLEQRRNQTKVPGLYRKGFPLDFDQATGMLVSCGLRASCCRLTLNDAKPQYRDCKDLQVVGSSPKQGTLVPPGSTIVLKCVPHEVIVRSQEIFEESEQAKMEAKEKRKADKLERKEQTRQGVEKIFRRDSKKMLKEENER